MDSTARLKARRPKPQLSCAPCRAKKQKCDRGRPCGNCIKTSATAKCVYVDGLQSSRSTTHPSVHASGTLHDGSSARIRNRLQVLDSRIAQLSQRANELPNERGSDYRTGSVVSPDLSTHGTTFPRHHEPTELLSPRLSTAQKDQHFISPSHWEGLLDDLEGLKLELDPFIEWEHDEAALHTNVPVSTHPNLLFLDEATASRDELITSLHSRSVVDSLLDIFFLQHGLMPLISVMLHTPTFLQDLERFWTDPRNVDLNWLSILYSIMCLSLQAELRAGRQVDGILLMEATCEMYAKKAVLCLRLADYAKPTKHTVEAMTFSLACEQFWIENEPYRASLVFSMIVRTALRIGYHRDPKHFPQISVFDAEMQRRSWALILQMDLFLAAKCGLPPLIDQSQSDTASPTNLMDADLSKDTQHLPLARPDAQPTVIGYLNYKTRLATAHRRIFDRLNVSTTLEYDEILRLDHELVTQIQTRPSWLDPPQINGSATVQMERIGPLIDADLIVHRARMALHHKLIVRARHDHQYIESRHIGLASAKQALFYQRILAEAPTTHIGGAKQTWRLLSLLAQDFLFAALVLSLDLNQDLKDERTLTDTARAPRVEEHLQLLRTSYRIWKQCLDHSTSAQQAYDIVGAMLDKFSHPQDTKIFRQAETHPELEALPPLSDNANVLRSQPAVAFPVPIVGRNGDLETFGQESMTAPTVTFESLDINASYNNFTSVDYDMVDTLLLGSEWPDLDFTTAVGML